MEHPKASFIQQEDSAKEILYHPTFLLLCSEGLLAMVLRAQQENKIQDIKVARGALAISHLFFADDSILFYQTTKEACDALQEILDTYEVASGQLVNKEKTNIFFSKNTRTEMKE